jgi:hypothetical protein
MIFSGITLENFGVTLEIPEGQDLIFSEVMLETSSLRWQ